MRYFILILAMVLIPKSTLAFDFQVASAEENATGLLATASPSANELSKCSGENDRFNWAFVTPNPNLDSGKSKISVSTPSKGDFFLVRSGQIPDGVGQNFFELFFAGNNKLTLFCLINNDFNNSKKISSPVKFSLDENQNISNVQAGNAPKEPKIKKAKPFNVPGMKVIPQAPQEGQTAADLFTFDPINGSINIQSTIEPSSDKKIFKGVSSRQLIVEITNNGSKDLVFVVEDLKTTNSVETPISIGATGTIQIPQSKILLSILRQDEPEGFPVDFDVTIKDKDGNILNDVSDFIGDVFNLTGSFDDFDSPEFITINTLAPVAIKVTPVDAQFEIEMFFKKVVKKKQLTAIEDGASLIFNLEKAGEYIVRLTPNDDEDDYEVIVEPQAI